MTSCIKYIEETLHIRVETFEYARMGDIPLYLKSSYTLRCLNVMGMECLLAKPKESQNLASMRKHCGQLKKLSGMECVLCIEQATAYARQKMIEEAIPFIIENKQVYMPFLGVALAKQNERDIQPVDEISFATQKLLLTTIYRRQEKMTLAEAATVLGVTKMTATRCFNELEGMDLPLITRSGKNRYFIWQGGFRALWELIRPVLRSPVRKQYRLGEMLTDAGMRLGGMSAICHYSMLTDNAYPTYAVSKEAAKEFRLDKCLRIPKGEIPAMVIQVMQYEIDFPDTRAVDPLTAILSLEKDVAADPRVESAIDEILKECMHG